MQQFQLAIAKRNIKHQTTPIISPILHEISILLEKYVTKATQYSIPVYKCNKQGTRVLLLNASC